MNDYCSSRVHLSTGQTWFDIEIMLVSQHNFSQKHSIWTWRLFEELLL